MAECVIKARLKRDAIQALTRVLDITQAQRKMIAEDQSGAVADLDRALEEAFGEKERAFGALWQHMAEHHC